MPVPTSSLDGRDCAGRRDQRRVRTRHRLVPERRDLARAAQGVDRQAAVALPGLRHARSPTATTSRSCRGCCCAAAAGTAATRSRRATRSSSCSPACCSPRSAPGSRTRGRCPRISCSPARSIALSAIDLEHFILPNRIVYPVDVARVVLLALASAARARLGRVRRGPARRRGRVRVLLRDPPRVAAGHGLRRRAPLVPARAVPRLARLGRGRRRAVRRLPLRRGDRHGADRGRRCAGRKQQIPFGPFLAAGAMTFVLFGEPIVDWYRGLGR